MKFLAAFILIQLTSFVLLAQPGPPPPDPGDPVPISFIEVLLVSGAAVGVRKLRNRKRNSP
jgi:hypothetical protein